MEFGVSRGGVLVLKRGKVIKLNGLKLPNDEII